VKLPIFVARQWIRHRTANVNEYSARYSILDHEYYLPEPAQMAPQSAANRQGREGEIPAAEKERMRDEIAELSDKAYQLYETLLNETLSGEVVDDRRSGLARELARMVLPTNYYTQWYWKVDLHNLFHFLSLRADDHAQYEIRAYAEAICGIVEKWVPAAWGAFEDYRLDAAGFSGPALGVLRGLIDEARLEDEATLEGLKEKIGLSAREFREFLASLKGD